VVVWGMFLKVACAILRSVVVGFVDKDWLRLGRLRPEEKVDLAIGMSDVCIRVCAEGIKAQHPGISDEELVGQLRERFEWMKRWRRRPKVWKM